MKLVYYTLMGNTKMLAEELPYELIEIDTENPGISCDDKFVLMIPSYGTGIVEIVCEFMDFQENFKKCKGILGIGEESYGDQYIQDAKELSSIYKLEILFDFENNHSDELKEKIIETISKI